VAAAGGAPLLVSCFLNRFGPAQPYIYFLEKERKIEKKQPRMDNTAPGEPAAAASQ
jgi:hypothetical protein